MRWGNFQAVTQLQSLHPRGSLDAPRSSGQTGEWMVNRLAGQLGSVPFKYFGDWTDRVAKGELPKTKPPRPSGIERNVVISSWEWATEKHFVHDLISSDRRNPTVNAYGPLYGSNEYSSDDMPILDPKTSTVTFFKMPVADPNVPEVAWTAVASQCHAKADWRVGLLGRRRRLEPARRTIITACSTARAGCGLRRRCAASKIRTSARRAPTIPRPRRFRSIARAASVDVIRKTMKYSFIDTCFGTHHPQFGYDADNTLWFSGTGPVAGWVNTRVWDETGDAVKAQGWAPFVLDTNGNGKLDEYTEPGAPAQADKDMRVARLRPLRRDAASDRRLDLVRLECVRRHAWLLALRSQDQAVGVLCHSEGGHRHARRRYRQERRALGLGSNGA